MKISLFMWENHWRYNTVELNYTQEQYDYAFKHLDFDQINKKCFIYFYKNEIEEWFYKTYINTDWLNDIYNDSLEGYEWLKQNWGKSVFKILADYQDKQEFKTIVNKVINSQLISK